MATAFAEIYAMFSNKITDYVLLELSDQDAVDVMHGYLISAIAKLRELRSGAFDYTEDDSYIDNDGNQISLGPHFLNTLIKEEKELLAIGMVEEWIEPQVKDVLLTRQFVSSKETQFFAQHNHLNGLLSLKKETKHDKDYLLTIYKTLHNEYLGTVEKTT